ncbi:hypothetical protein LCGC14_1541810 [marine sediment metagenome]|uniref:Uncharacterized protein n=1 Tax=marine sediment metagenome TaxID=412755 RepID=A0A0F9ISV3_9ZZZZ
MEPGRTPGGMPRRASGANERQFTGVCTMDEAGPRADDTGQPAPVGVQTGAASMARPWGGSDSGSVVRGWRGGSADRDRCVVSPVSSVG